MKQANGCKYDSEVDFKYIQTEDVQNKISLPMIRVCLLKLDFREFQHSRYEHYGSPVQLSPVVLKRYGKL